MESSGGGRPVTKVHKNWYRLQPAGRLWGVELWKIFWNTCVIVNDYVVITNTNQKLFGGITNTNQKIFGANSNYN